MAELFLEVLLNVDDCLKIGIESRDEIEDELIEKVASSGLGCISGGGGGMGRYNIDVDIFDEGKLDEAVALLRRALEELHAPPSTKIVCHMPFKREWSIGS